MKITYKAYLGNQVLYSKIVRSRGNRSERDIGGKLPLPIRLKSLVCTGLGSLVVIRMTVGGVVESRPSDLSRFNYTIFYFFVK